MAKFTLTTLSEQIVRDMDDLAMKLQTFLLEHGVKPSDSKLSSLVKSFNDLNVIVPGKKYYHFEINKEGYIKDFSQFGAAIESKETLPVDITRGYYRVEDGKIVLDEKQRQKLWEVS